MKESNTLIANFLGLELQEDNTYFDYEVNEYINKEDLNYNTSWDMLMQVVDKIESIFISGQYSVSVVFEVENQCIITVLYQPTSKEGAGKYKTKQFGNKSNNKKEAVYNACVDFIEWWNEETKSNKN